MCIWSQRGEGQGNIGGNKKNGEGEKDEIRKGKQRYWWEKKRQKRTPKFGSKWKENESEDWRGKRKWKNARKK